MTQNNNGKRKNLTAREMAFGFDKNDLDPSMHDRNRNIISSGLVAAGLSSLSYGVLTSDGKNPITGQPVDSVTSLACTVAGVAAVGTGYFVEKLCGERIRQRTNPKDQGRSAL